MRLYNGVYRLDRPSIRNAVRIDAGCMPAVHEMNQTGVLVDRVKLAAMDADLSHKHDVALSALRGNLGMPNFNPGSTQQVGRLLYTDMGLVPLTGMRYTETGIPSTDDTALAGMASLAPDIVGKAGDLERGEQPVGILGVRQLAKLRGTYTGPDAMVRLIGPDERLRTTFSLTKARTGRFTSESPNMQNVPPFVRKVVVARPGCVLVSHDLSQIEMLWTGELSGDENMIRVFRTGQDMHVKTACAIFGRDYQATAANWKLYKDKSYGLDTKAPLVWADMRQFELAERLPAKTIGFAVVYGTSPAGLQSQIVMQGGPYLELDMVEQYIQGWYGFYPGVRQWLALQVYRARMYGMVWSGFGRPRMIPESSSSVRRIAAAGDRQTGNTPVQGTAGEHLKIALGQLATEYIDGYWSKRGYCKLVLQIHDELITEVEVGMAEDYAQQTRELLEGCVPMQMPVKSSYSISDNWGGLK